MHRWVLFLAAACSTTPAKPFGASRWAVSLPTSIVQGQPALPYVAVDASGDVFAGGSFRGTVDFGTGPITDPAENLDAGWLVKLSASDGSLLWAAALATNPGTPGAPNSLDVSGINVNDDGNVLVSGVYQGNVVIGNALLSANQGYFVASYAADGTFASAHAVVGGDLVALAPDGKLAVVGMCHAWPSSIVFPNETLACAVGSTITEYIALLAPDGSTLWGHALPGQGHSFAWTVTGNLLVTGTLDHAATIGTTLLDPAAPTSRYAAAISKDGDWLWADILDDHGSSAVAGPVVANGAGGGVSIGTVAGSLTFDRFDEQGRASGTETTQHNAIPRVATSDPTAIYVAGPVSPFTVDFGHGPVRASMYLAAFDHSGSFLDVRGYGDPAVGIGVISAVAVTSDGAVAIAGAIEDQLVDFGNGSATGTFVGMFDSP